jgi:phosphoadenosine phosphosulfate reductase
MSIYEKDMFGKSKHSMAINRIAELCSGKRVLCAFSGGKDSQVCYHLLKESGIDFHAEYSITRFEPPELLSFIRVNYPDVTFRRAYKKSLTEEIAYHGLPNMWVRWCCAAKHQKTEGYDIAVIGIRWEESSRRRATWRMFGYKPDKTAYICPICDWTEQDVWEYLCDRPHCSLYDEGFSRIGCVCCPLSPSTIAANADRWPKTARMLKRAAFQFVERMRERGYKTQCKDCADWSKTDDPHNEYWYRWLKTGQTQKSVEAFKNAGKQEEGLCLFEGTGFSERDGIGEDV